MGRVLTNNVALIVAVEQTETNSDNIGLLPGETAPGVGVNTAPWAVLEPNAINAYGATITTVARSPISNLKQRRKGTVTDLDSSVDFEEDFTMSSFRNFADGFVFATGVNSDVTLLDASNPETTGDTYTIAALTAATAAKFPLSGLIWASGFTASGNNGLKEIAVAAADTDTDLDVVEDLTDETGTGKVSFAGYRVPTASTVTWDWDAGSNQATLNATGLGTLLGTLGLTPGQFVHIGSKASLDGAIQNAFENSSANDMFGYARVVSVSTDDVVFDKVDAALQFDDTTDPATPVDIVFGEFFRNVPTDNADFLERTYQFEAEFPNLGDGTVGNTDTAYQYSRGNTCNTVGFNFPLTDKATISYGFIGVDTDNPTTTQKALAATAEAPTLTQALNTSSDIARLRITEVDEDGITTDFKNVVMNINNNVTPGKCLANLGAAYINSGNFEVDLEMQLLFTNPLVINKIRDNETVTMEFIVNNDDGVVVIDIPSMTLGGGDREFPLNETVLINTTAQAFVDPQLETSIGLSTMPVPLS